MYLGLINNIPSEWDRNARFSTGLHMFIPNIPTDYVADILTSDITDDKKFSSWAFEMGASIDRAFSLANSTYPEDVDFLRSMAELHFNNETNQLTAVTLKICGHTGGYAPDVSTEIIITPNNVRAVLTNGENTARAVFHYYGTASRIVKRALIGLFFCIDENDSSLWI